MIIIIIITTTIVQGTGKKKLENNQTGRNKGTKQLLSLLLLLQT